MDESWACPRCDAPYGALEERGRDAIRCASCGLVFGTPEVHVLTRPDPLRPADLAIGTPSGLIVAMLNSSLGTPYRDGESRAEGLTITRKWPQQWLSLLGVAPSLFFLCLYFDPKMGIGSRDPLYLVCAAVMLLPALYLALAFQLNRTVIQLRGDALTVKHGPIPWYGGRRLTGSRISQLWCTEYVRRESVTYLVHYVEHGGATGVFLNDLQSVEEALFVERIIERALRIEDRPIAFELPK